MVFSLDIIKKVMTLLIHDISNRSKPKEPDLNNTGGNLLNNIANSE